MARLGLVRSFQISAVFAQMTVLENVRVALQRSQGTSFHFWKSERSLDSLNEQALHLLEEVGLREDANRVTASLPYGRKRALELATTLALEPTVMLLDEPTQGMGAEDVDRVVELIRVAARGRTVQMVEHNLSVVSRLCRPHQCARRADACWRKVTDASVSADPEVREAYLGSEVTDVNSGSARGSFMTEILESPAKRQPCCGVTPPRRKSSSACAS